MKDLTLSRRRALGLLGGAALAAVGGKSIAAASAPRVVVVGAGILGAAIAYELSKRGARVTVLERNKPASATTGDSFAYLNASTKVLSSHPYYDLNLRGMVGWHRWQRELGGALPLQWGGSVYWRDAAAPASKLAETLAKAQAWGYGASKIDAAAIERLLPGVVPGKVELAGFYEEEGAVDPAAAVEVLLGQARKQGVELRYPIEVQGVLTQGGRVRGVRTQAGVVEADAVVIAAGLGSRLLAEELGLKLPLTRSEGVLVHTQPQKKLLDRVVFAPNASLRQLRDGTVVASSGHEGASAEGDRLAQGRRILDHAAAYFPALQGAAIKRVSVGERVLPADSFPVVGAASGVDGLYLAVSHSGVTLAPAIGRYAAQEILDGIKVDALSSFRPSRFD